MRSLFANKGILTWAVSVLLASAFFGFGIFSAGARRTALGNQIAKLRASAQDVQRREAATSTSGLKPDLVRAQVMDQMTNELASVSSATGVKLSQLQFEPTATPIPSPAKPSSDRTPKAGNWGLNNLSFAIEGPTPQVYLAIRQIAKLHEPFQLTEVAINRVVSAATGEQGVTANVKAALLVPSEGNK